MINLSLSNALLSATGWLIGMLISIVVVAALLSVVLVIALKPIKKYQPEEEDTVKKLDRREAEITIKLLEHSTDPQQTEALLKELREISLAERVVHRITEQEKAANKAPTPQHGKPAGHEAQSGQPQHKPEQPVKPVQPQGKPVQPAQPAQPQNKPEQPAQPAQPQGKPVQPAQPAQPQSKPEQPATAANDTKDKKD